MADLIIFMLKVEKFTSTFPICQEIACDFTEASRRHLNELKIRKVGENVL